MPRVDDVALGLGHLGALLVHEEPEAHDVAVRRRAEHQGVHGQQGVEPPARLVDGLADEVGWIRLQLAAVVERVVVLGRGHGPGVEPGVQHGGEAAGGARAALLRARKGDVIDVGTVQVEIGEGTPCPIAQLRDGTDADVGPAVTASPHRKGCAPVAVARQGPVDVALEPLAEPTVLDVLRMPADALVLLEQLGPSLRRAGEPRRLGPVDERRATAPAVRVGVLVGLLGHQDPAFGEGGDDGAVSVLDEGACVGLDAVVEGAVFVHGVEDGQSLGPADLGIFLAEGRGDVDDARAVAIGHVGGGHDAPRITLGGVEEGEGPLVVAALQLGAAPGGQGRAGGITPRGGGGAEHEVTTAVGVGDADVRQVGAHGGGHVGDQRPGGGRPHEQIGARRRA